MEYVKKKKMKEHNYPHIRSLEISPPPNSQETERDIKVIMFISNAKYSAKQIKYVFQTGEFIPNIKITEKKMTIRLLVGKVMIKAKKKKKKKLGLLDPYIHVIRMYFIV